MTTIRKVTIIGAGGNFGTLITQALRAAGFDLIIISRLESQTQLPDDIPPIRTSYCLHELSATLRGQDAVVCVVGPASIPLQTTIMDAAEAARVQRFVIDEFGRAPGQKGLPDFKALSESRRALLRYAVQGSRGPFQSQPGTDGQCVPPKAIKKFSTMGFDITRRSAIIYDQGSEPFTGVTLAAIGLAVVGVLQNPGQTANKHLCIPSLQTRQNDILAAFEVATGKAWKVERSTSAHLVARVRAKKEKGESRRVLDLVVGELYEEGAGNSVVVEKEKSDNELLGVDEEDLISIVRGLVADV